MLTKKMLVGILSTLVIGNVAFAAPPALKAKKPGPGMEEGDAVVEEQGTTEGKKEKKLPKSGSLSTSRSSGSVNSSVADVWGGTDVTGNDAPPISGSVSRLNPNTWRMRVFNNTEDTYSVDLSVVQKTESGSTVKTDSYSYTLRPKDSKQQDMTAGNGAAEAELVLRNYKNLSAKKRTPTPAPSAAPQGAGRANPNQALPTS